MSRTLSVVAFVAGALFTFADPMTAAPRARAVRMRATAPLPPCTQITGVPAVAMSLDGGRSTLPHTEKLEDVQLYTFGLTVTDTPGRVLAVLSRLLVISDDSGCSWRMAGLTFPERDYRLISSASGLWAWSPLGDQLFRLGASLETYESPVALPIGFAAEADGKLTIADDTGTIWTSNDAALTWNRVATSPSRPPLYVVEFSPRGARHAITSGLADGANVTFDNGATWESSKGLERLNVFRIVFSPVDPGIVWAIALDPLSTERYKRGIYRSADGGRSFRLVLRESQSLDFPNGFTLAPAPRDPSLLWFVLPGSMLYLVDASGSILMRTPLPYRDVNAIRFSPERPEVMYMGLKVSDMSLTP